MLAGQPAAYATPYSYYPAAVNPWQVRYQPCPPPGYDESPGLKPLDREQGKTHLVRKFDHVEESLSFYMHTLNSHPAYHKLRQIRQQLRREQQPVDGHTLADGLEEYSAIGEQYIHTIQTIIQQNDWGNLDIIAQAV